MNANEIDELYNLISNEEWEKVLKIIGEDPGNKDFETFAINNNDLICSKIMKMIEAGDYDYFYKNYVLSDESDKINFSMFFFKNTSRISDIKEFLIKCSKDALSSAEIIDLIKATKDVIFMREVIEDEFAREKFNLYGSKCADIIKEIGVSDQITVWG